MVNIYIIKYILYIIFFRTRHRVAFGIRNQILVALVCFLVIRAVSMRHLLTSHQRLHLRENLFKLLRRQWPTSRLIFHWMNRARHLKILLSEIETLVLIRKEEVSVKLAKSAVQSVWLMTPKTNLTKLLLLTTKVLIKKTMKMSMNYKRLVALSIDITVKFLFSQSMLSLMKFLVKRTCQ